MKCLCCGRAANDHDARWEDGRVHFMCWSKHHSDPGGAWPDDHHCSDGVQR